MISSEIQRILVKSIFIDQLRKERYVLKMTEDSNGTIKTVSDISMETGCCMAKKLKNVSNKNHKKKRSQRKLSQKLYAMTHII